MTQRPYKYSRKACRIYRTSAEQRAPAAPLRRPTLYGTADPERLATERSRARLMHQLTHPKDSLLSRDFAAYFQSSPKNYPTYALTSHTSSKTRPNREPVIPTYPVQALRWNPYVETSSIDDIQSDGEDASFQCMCENCSKRKSESQESPSTYKPGKFKNNIMTFVDRYTMTPRLADAGCGCNVVPCTRESDVSVTASEIAVRDARASMKINQSQSPKMPAPILKKNKPQPICHYCNTIECDNIYSYSDECEVLESKYREAEKDNRDDRLDRVTSMKSLSFNFCNNGKQGNRIMLYNEGISDSVANQYPVVPMSMPTCTNLRKDCSRVSMKSARPVRYYVEDERPIPYSHRSDSRYHQFCKSSESRVFFLDEDRRSNLSPGLPSRPRGMRCRTLPSKLPKRVLTSDGNIDAYVESSYPRIGLPVAARRKNKC